MITSPNRCALLPLGVAQRHLTEEVLTGQEAPPRFALENSVVPLDDPSPRWETDPVRDLLTEATARFASRRTRADAWLAPRLHATLRMTRQEAARKELWAHLALLVSPEFVIWRHRPVGEDPDGESPKPTPEGRFVGSHSTQALARLWWAAELFRDGADYRPAEIACSQQDMFQTALRLDVIDHRPTALAVVRVLEQLLAGGAADLTAQVNALCRAINVAGGTLAYEVIGPDQPPDDQGLLTWIDEAASAPPVSWDRLPDGPDDGTAPPRSVTGLTELFGHLLSETDLRARTAGPAARDLSTPEGRAPSPATSPHPSS